ncbi:MAG: hypothetical protein J0I88_03945 [Chryseobacterium sp.]|nr:hypothetical protein [Chryseobacterium sp.]OJX32663.1 MAG: hypothetical protein BGO86_10410 [Chryseobacterium sp. 36-9]
MKKQITFLSILFLLLVTLINCKNPDKPKEKSVIEPSAPSNFGEKIEGDFNGDGQTDFATVVKIKEGEGNPVEDGTSDEYEVRFSDKGIIPIKAGCCNIRLVNEGDLDNDGADEISLFQAPMNGCTYTMTTYSLKNATWEQIVEPFLIPTGCGDISDSDLQKRVFKENNQIYYYRTDPNDENGKLIKTLNKPASVKGKLSINEAVKQAEKQFVQYLPKILKSRDGILDVQQSYTGDFTGDGIEDIAIYFSLASAEGGNAIVGRGMALYKNEGNKVKVIAGYEPDYLFTVDTISNGKIVIEKMEYAETDGRCCPSIRTKHTLTISGNRVY